MHSDDEKAASVSSDSSDSSSVESSQSGSSVSSVTDVDLTLLEWGVPRGPYTRIHRLSDGELPGCAKGASLGPDDFGCSFSLAVKLHPTRLWCKRCARDLFELCERKGAAKVILAAEASA